MTKRKPDPAYLQIIDRLRAARAAQGLSQTQLAARMTDTKGYNWHQTTVARIEAGSRMLTVGEYLAVTDLLDMDWADSLTGPA